MGGVMSADVPYGGGCHGFVDVASLDVAVWPRDSPEWRDPQALARDVCARHAIEACDQVLAQVRHAYYHKVLGLTAVRSMAGDTEYEYAAAPEPNGTVVRLTIDRRTPLLFEWAGVSHKTWAGPQTDPASEATSWGARLGMSSDDVSVLEKHVGDAQHRVCASLEAWRSAPKRDDSQLEAAIRVLKGCERLFVDLGAHDGSTMRAFFGRGASHGGLSNWTSQNDIDASRFCALGVEPSPDFDPVVPGAPNVVFALSGYAASDEDADTVLFFGDGTQVGNSLRFEAPDVYVSGRVRSTPVRAFRLVSLLANLFDGALDHLVLKIDIEGAEYLVLRDLLSSGLLCSRATNNNASIDILLEEHTYMRDFFTPDAPPDALRAYAHALRACGVRVDIDEHRGRGGLTD